MDITGSRLSIANPFTSVIGTGSGTTGFAIYNASGQNTLTGDITLGGNASFGSADGILNSFVFTGVLTTGTYIPTLDGSTTLLTATSTCIPCQQATVSSGAGTPGGDGSGAQLVSGGLAGTGFVDFGTSELDSAGSGLPWSQEPIWTNMPALATGNTGSGMAGAEMPQLLDIDANTVVLTDASVTRWFDLSGGSYSERFGNQDRLTHNTTTHTFTLSDSSGQTLVFYDFDSSNDAPKQGQLVSVQASGGSSSALTTTLQYATTSDTAYVPDQLMNVVLASSSGSAVERYHYTYKPSTDLNAGLVDTIELDHSSDGGATWTAIRKVAYVYYSGSISGGSQGDLEFAYVEAPDGTVIDTTYYRYYTTFATSGGHSIGYPHALQYVFSNASYERLATAGFSDANYPTYADESLQYDSQHRITQMVTQGRGCSVCSAGLGTFSYTYTQANNSDPSDHSRWSMETTESFVKAGTTLYSDTYFTNSIGEAILTDHHDNTTGIDTIDGYYYDSAGRLTEHDSPATISGYTATQSTGALSVSYTTAGGLIEITDYYSGSPTTTAIDTSNASTLSTTGVPPGGVPGYVQDHKVKQHRSDSGILQDTTTYYLIQDGPAGLPIAVQAATTVYSTTTATDPSSSGAETTVYGYSFFQNTTQVQQQTTTLPSITADEASSAGDKSYEVFDQAGRTVWTKDAEGYIGYTGYDAVTGEVSLSIQDIDPSQLNHDNVPPTVPSGWSLTGSHLNLKTEYEYQLNANGRTVIETDPVGNITFTIYDDVNKEVRTYRGWTKSGSTYVRMTNPPPTEVTREDQSGAFTESLTMTAPLTTSDVDPTTGAPLGTEAIAAVTSLSRSLMDSAGQVTETDNYYDLSVNHTTSATWAYSASTSQIGTAWNHSAPAAANYYVTTTQYGDFGQVSKTVTPDGAITRTITDSLGRVTSTWIGTDDSPASGQTYWSVAYPHNMSEVSANAYDIDSNLVLSVQFPAGNGDSVSNFRVTEMHYDWRDRLVSTKSGALVTEVSSSSSTTYRIDGLSDAPSSPKWLQDAYSSETDAVQRPISYSVLDNLGEVVTQYTYKGNAVLLSAVGDGGTPSSTYNSKIRAQTDTLYDSQGRAYSTTVWDVNQSTGAHNTATGNNTETTHVFFNYRGLVAYTTDALGFETDYVYDGAGRQTSVTLPSPDGSTGAPQTLTTYNADGTVHSVRDPRNVSVPRSPVTLAHRSPARNGTSISRRSMALRT